MTPASEKEASVTQSQAGPSSAPKPPHALQATGMLRFINRDGTLNIRRVGLERRALTDVYHRLLVASWPRFLSTLAAAYFAINMLFGFLYWLDPGGVENTRPGSYADSFYFSIQTMATIGYGKMVPADSYCHAVVTLESLCSMLFTALMTGLIFAKFARPTARILFSKHAVIAPRDGIPSLVFRVANERGNNIAEATLRVTLFRNERTLEGELVRRYYDLPLFRNSSPLFMLTWTAVHQITKDSLLHGHTAETLAAEQIEILVTLTGTDNTFAQTVHARHSYRVGDLRWNERLVDLLRQDENGGRYVDYRVFHDTMPQEPPKPLPLEAPKDQP